MQATLAELAVLVDGRLIGNGNLIISGSFRRWATPSRAKSR